MLYPLACTIHHIGKLTLNKLLMVLLTLLEYHMGNNMFRRPCFPSKFSNVCVNTDQHFQLLTLQWLLKTRCVVYQGSVLSALWYMLYVRDFMYQRNLTISISLCVNDINRLDLNYLYIRLSRSSHYLQNLLPMTFSVASVNGC